MKKYNQFLHNYCKIKDLVLFQAVTPPVDSFIFIVLGIKKYKNKVYALISSPWLGSPLNIWQVPFNKLIFPKNDK